MPMTIAIKLSKLLKVKLFPQCVYIYIYFFFFGLFLGPHLQHMEVPRLGVQSEL